ncbi:phosphoribosyltransferase [Gallaecimonas kandeliae]|uniref:phosphoribosyltransferase n=1 Tax=Gallaecimonas kandeliae TaxID=3029055 RepID=UPI00264A4494|nr:phosphoribosyltransferase [Gallaecimonas kandeliae]WKE64431.1 phosphoribosyltransferase [Gallaecimonas kandeliae]
MKLPLDDRQAAGLLLAEALLERKPPGELLVLALPRGGVPVAAVIAKRLGAGLDLMLVRKLGFPGHKELAMGAIASGGIEVLNEDLVASGYVNPDALARVRQDERQELARRDKAYRGSRPWPSLKGKTVILVDDGVATGATMLAAVKAARGQEPAAIWVAVPVAPMDTLHKLKAAADQVVCLAAPEPFMAIGQWYRDFSQTEDEEVLALLDEAWNR